MKLRTRLAHKVISLAVIFGITAMADAIAFWRMGANAEEVVPSKPMIRPVKAVFLHQAKVGEIRSFPGIVEAASETELAFRVGGPLIEFGVNIGQPVQKGEVIARIDPRDFEVNVMRLTAAIEEASANLRAMRTGARAEDIARLEADLSAARARLTEAESNYRRYEKLIVHKAVSQANLDHSRTEFDTAKARVDVAMQSLKKARSGARREDIEAAEARIKLMQADLKTAQNALADTYLRAPFSGYVHHQKVENYQTVKGGDPIVSLLDFSQVEVHTAIPEELIIRRSEIVDITCALDAYPGHRFPATVKEIGRKTDSANQSYPLTVILHLPDDIDAQPGMAATVSVSINSAEQPTKGFILPLGAVFADSEGQSCVWRIDPESMTVIRTQVQTGTLSRDTIQIVAGLDSGDRVVTAGARFLRNGQPIRILDAHPEKRS